MSTGPTLYPFAETQVKMPIIVDAEINDDELVICELDGQVQKIALEHFEAKALYERY